jgi:predicted phage terminase large subunit-like protein
VTTATARRLVYQRPYLYPKQEEAIFTPARYGVIEASTKTGKTVGCLVWIHEQAALYGGWGKNYWWIAPTFPTSRIAYRRLKRFLPDGSFTANETEMTLTLANGAVIWFKSGDKPDSLFGEDVYAAVIDEATRMKEDAWYAIRSTLTATKGPVRIIGNVKGRKNWAYKLARRAEAGTKGYHYAKLTVWDAVEAGVFDQEEAEDAKDILPDAVFRELYLAEPADEGDQFFNVGKLETVESYPDSAKVCRVWDFAVTEDDGSNPDFTVGLKVAFDGRLTYICDIVRRRAAPDQITETVRSTAKGDGSNCKQVIEEEKGAAGKIMVALFKRMLAGMEKTGRVVPAPVTGSKEVRAFHFASAVNDGRVVLVQGDWNDAFKSELDWFPGGDHDDQVDAAAHGYNHLVPTGRPRVRWL